MFGGGAPFCDPCPASLRLRLCLRKRHEHLKTRRFRGADEIPSGARRTARVPKFAYMRHSVQLRATNSEGMATLRGSAALASQSGDRGRLPAERQRRGPMAFELRRWGRWTPEQPMTRGFSTGSRPFVQSWREDYEGPVPSGVRRANPVRGWVGLSAERRGHWPMASMKAGSPDQERGGS